jgi:hypothetical protein
MTWDYIAGFFDGEGSFSMKNGCVRVAITQTDEVVLNSIKKFANVGNVCMVTKRKSHWKDCWVYYITNQKDVFYFLSKIENKVIVKKTKVSLKLPLIKEYLENAVEKQFSLEKRGRYLVKLRSQGLSYREIGEKANIDWGFARRIILRDQNNK